ncbi:hypothetical protein [Parvicella tangerina]|uniref:Uncharacterized protein n=1 Tax=Parvicella tangerina TaxID=2829795 RepID=A0A916JPT2_9FLAO|nr:hypothetical protein [Parvicella tangerina]CAG5085936.1 hypothetical protein CRYO30217_02938 [Parvicella tangerina]
MQYPKTLSLILGLAATSLMIGQNYAPIKDVSTLKKHEIVLSKTFPSKFEHLKIKNVYKINDKHTAVGYLEDETYHEVVVNNNKEEMLLVANSVEVTTKEVPGIIQQNWKESFGKKWKMDKVLYSKTPYGEDFYTVVMYQTNKDNSKEWNREHYDEYGKEHRVAF